MRPAILADVCQNITGQAEYTVEFDNEGYNKGQLAVLQYNETISHIFLFEKKESRNACFQSFPTSLVKHLEDDLSENIYCYFLPLSQDEISKIQTDYFKFMYRLMKTVGAIFINEDLVLNDTIYLFQTVEDVILAKK